MAGETSLVRRFGHTMIGCMMSLSVWASADGCYPSLDVPAEENADDAHQFFPKSHIFQPLIADPREPRFFLGYRSDERFWGRRQIGVIGFGETFPIYRRNWGCGTGGWQVDVAGGGVARFDMENGSNDMIDIDYLIGLPLSWRRGSWSVRTRLFHESSHLGESQLIEEVLGERRIRTTNSVDLTGSYTWAKWRLYSGGEYLISNYPEMEPLGFHLGAEYYGPRIVLKGTARWVTALDVKAWQEYEYDADVSFKTGLTFGGRDVRQHHLQVMLEWYEGHANSGVHTEEQIRYVGMGLYFGF